MGIVKEIFKQIEKELKSSMAIDKPKRKNKNAHKIQIQNIGYMRKKPRFTYVHFVRVKFNLPYVKNITF